MNKIITRLLQRPSDQRGVVFITILIVGMIVTFVGLSFADLTISQYGRTSDNLYRTNAILLAEAGIETTLSELSADDNFSGTTEETTFYEDDRGRGSYTSTVETGPNGEKTITGTGTTYKPASKKIASKQKVRVTLVGTAAPVPSVVAGAGGLILGGSASINNSDVHVNGSITFANSAASIGSETHPVSVQVANANCPKNSNPGPTYPSVCATGQPINIPDWSNVKILGTICATGQTQAKFPESQWNSNQPQIRAASAGGSGLVSDCTAPVLPMPTYDRASHISRMTTTGTMSNNTYNCNNWISGAAFDRTWPANLRLNDNVSIGSSCNLTITGDVYISGNLTVGGGSTIRIADSLGTTIPRIVVDGTVNLGSGGKVLANSSGTSAQIISYRSTASCSPSCANVTGTDLYNSRNQQNVTVDGGGSFPGLGVWAYWSKAKINGAGIVGAVTGQTIDMEGAGNVTFGTSLGSGTTTWTIRSYQRVFE